MSDRRERHGHHEHQHAKPLHHRQHLLYAGIERFDVSPTWDDNETVSPLRIISAVCLLVVPPAMICDDLIRFALSADAHRCCAATAGTCAQLSAPDECCQTRQQATSQGHDAVAPDARVTTHTSQPLAVIALPIAATVAAPAIAAQSSRATFKRPHDPPHLHPFPLLI